jgi:ribosomal protein S18 acetylase RimI-like enzyme
MQRAQHLYEKLGFKRDPGQDNDDSEWGTFFAYRMDL